MIRYLKKIKSDSYSFSEIVLIGSFFISALLLLAGALGVFNRIFVATVFLFLVAMGYYLRKNISEIKYWQFFLLVPAVSLGFMLLRGFFIGDVYYHWLPFAREIALTGSFPDFVNFNWFSVMPLPTLLMAATFSLFGTLSQFANLWMPLVFSAATLIVLLEWGKHRKLDRKYWIFLGVLFLTNASFLGLSWNPMQDPLILFFATCFFYYYDRFLEERSRRNLFFLLLSLMLAALAKYNGIFLLLFLPFLFSKAKDKLFFLKYTLIFSLPLFYWFARNYAIYGNPVFPVLNGFFGGPYADTYSQFFEYAHHQFTPYPTLASKLKFISTALLEELPYILLAVYGLIKKRAWIILGVFGAYFIYKEVFLFSSTSGVRYYYLFLGLILIYALDALQGMRSKIVLGGLVALAFYQLFSILPVDSESLFISRFENIFSFALPAVNLVYAQRLFLALGLGVLSTSIKDIEKTKTVLLYLYSLFALKLRFVVNKSWINIWPAIASGIAFLLGSFMRPLRFYQIKIAVALLVVIVFLNSWVMGSAYYLNQGRFEFPVSHIWADSARAKGVLDRETADISKDSFYIMIFANRGYFLWKTDYRAVTYSDFDFHELVDGRYHKDLGVEETKKLLIEYNIKYIVINELSNDTDYTDFGNFADLVADSNLFELIAEDEASHKVWRVY